MDLQTRNQYMKAMGIPVWMPRDLCVEPETESTPDQPAETAATLADTDTSISGNKVPNHPDAPPPARNTAEEYFNTAPAQPTPATQSSVPATAQKKAPPAVTTEIIAPDCSTMNWSTLQQTVTTCQLCSLHKSRTQTVFGSGDTQADWMIIGEAPGAEEDRQGQPFVGRAGKLLNNMLAAVGLPRNAVYISNVLKCRPPNNRDPKADESALCRGYLERQIALLKPELIIVVGRIAAHNLLHTTTPLGRLRGNVHTLPESDTPVIVTYHPAYLLRQPAEKRKAWQDLQLARQLMAARQR